MSQPSFMAGFDSASGMANALAHYLRGEPFETIGNPPVLRGPAQSIRRFSRKTREKAFIAAGAAETISPRRVHRLDLGAVGDWLADEYPDTTYPAVAIGSSNGALNHLYAAMGIPWLPQTILVPVRQKVHPDDPKEALRRGERYGRRLVEAHPGIQLHHMHDPNQDRLMVRALTYFRIKRRVLGQDYEQLLRDRLPPGGTIIVADCRRTWTTTQVAERFVFQHGAPGGATESEYHHGSARVAEYLRRYDSPVRRWEGPELDGQSPEAEWGFEPSLLDDIQRFADEHGHRVVRLSFDDPEDASPLVADLHRWWYRRRRIPSNRLIVSSFAVTEPYWTARTGSVPFWMKFNTEPSLASLDEYLRAVDPYDEIYLMLFQHGVEAVGVPGKEQWEAVLGHARRTGNTLGVDLDEFPLDFSHFARYDQAIPQQIPSRYPLPAPLQLSELEEFLAGHKDDYPVEYHH
ncbi:hypothetical protein [Phytoactinopolyspora alkaliphila]|nr:hypothetical protein [Phytoactinopolyspora alkaliphila]